MKLKSILLIFSMVFAYTFSIAQHGGLDNTFGTNGMVTTPIGVGGDNCRDIAIQDDGKILLVGSTDNGTNDDLALARYNADGTLDTSFDEDGDVSINLGGDEYGRAVVALSDGKILVAGRRGESPNNDMLVYKFNGDGSIDMLFGTNGRVVLDFGSTNDISNNILLTPEGKIVVTGNVTNGSDTDFAVARLNADGTNDNTFGAQGKATFDLVESDACFSSVLQPDGKLILFGRITLAGNRDFAMVRCNENGSLDNNFGSGGMVVTDLGGGVNDRGHDVALQTDGKIVAVGLTDPNSLTAKLGAVRYNTDGSLDDTFGEGGIVSEAVGTQSYESQNFVAIQSDGKILVAGTSTIDFDHDAFTLLRLNPNGSYDNTFGDNGIVHTADLSTKSDAAKGIAIQDDSKILVCGRAHRPEPSNENSFAMVRYLSGLELGVLDFSVANNSMLVYPNPLQEVAVLEYTLINNETISIDLYDISGKIVQSFINSENRDKGNHKESLNLNTSIPSGAYILTLSNGIGSLSVQLLK